jgi:cell division protein FtsB
MDNFQEILKHIVDTESKKTVGIAMKRFELALKDKDSLSTQEVNDLKSQVKEVIYEAYRNLRDFIQTGKIIFETKQEQK